MKSIKRMTEVELAALVATRLRRAGIEVVLSGGTCVSIYSGRRYVSMDLDLVNVKFAGRRQIRESMAELGFNERGRSFAHPDAPYLVEFPPGPLAVGEEPVRRVDEMKVSTGLLKLLSPTDCVKDRLAWFFHCADRQCLEQAALVAEANDVDLREIRRWSASEGKLVEFERIRRRLKRGRA